MFISYVYINLSRCYEGTLWKAIKTQSSVASVSILSLVSETSQTTVVWEVAIETASTDVCCSLFNHTVALLVLK